MLLCRLACAKRYVWLGKGWLSVFVLPAGGQMQTVSNWEHGSHRRLEVIAIKPPTYSILLELSDMFMLGYIYIDINI